jgi:hypothetical protein
VATYTIGTASGGYYNNRGANNPPYNYGSSFSVPNGKCWLVTDVIIQMAGNSTTETVYGHIWDADGDDYWQGGAVTIAADATAPFPERNLGDPGSTKLLNNIGGTRDIWWVGFSKTAADSVNWDVVNGTDSTATGDTVNGDLSDFSPPTALARRLVGKFTYTEVTAPSAPVLTATGGNGEVALSWTAPASGGVAISSYTLKRGTTTLYTGANRTFTETGLANGTSYTYTVSATNGVGTSATDSASATTWNVPGTPAPTAAAGIREVTVTFADVAANGSAVSSYNYSLDDVNWSGAITSPHTITGLANGTSYTVRVRANNAVGTSATGTATAVTTASLPSNPTSLTANAGTFGVIGLSWTASNGNGYAVTYTVKRGGTTLGTTTSTTFNDTTVAPSTAYTYTVTASTSVGSSGDASVSATSLGGIVRVWNGTDWTTQVGLTKVWDGSAWVTAQARVWNGSEWKYGI